MYKFSRSSFPSKCGVYIFKDSRNNIIYIGKAKNLKNRISSYFTSKHDSSPKTKFLVRNISDVEYIVVNSEVEALILENKLIKKHKPKYNIFLKDSKTYAYIKVTDEKIPKIMFARKITDDGEYFGPFTDGSIRRELFDLTVRIFRLVTNKTYSTKSKLNYEIGLAPAPSVDKINRDDYLKCVSEAKLFLKGKNTKSVLNRLKTQMRIASDNSQFEKALLIKNQIEAILSLNEKQSIELVKKYNQDVISLVCDENSLDCVITLFNINHGVISGKKDFKFEYDSDLFESFIKMYYSSDYAPYEIIVNIDFWENEEEKEILERYLSKIKGSKCILTKPQRGEKLKLSKLATSNAKETLGKKSVLNILKKELKLKRVPNVIECFDMSNLSYDFLVGGMVRFVNQIEDKEGYRKFEIKSFRGKNDDVRATREVIYRRYKRLTDERSKLPDLIIIDGGLGQLNSALKSLEKLDLADKIDVISIGKGKKRDKNEIYKPQLDKPLIFDDNSLMMLFLRKVRDSAHNFVISYNRKKRDMKFREEMK